MNRIVVAVFMVAGALIGGASTVAQAQVQGQPGARPGSERAIIFVGGKKKVSKRVAKRGSPRDQRAINPQPLPPKTR